VLNCIVVISNYQRSILYQELPNKIFFYVLNFKCNDNNRIIIKQWPLNSEFVEFEYSPKWPFSEMCRTRQTRRHSPSRVARTRQNRRHSPSRVVRTRQTRRHSPSRVARTRQTRERRVWQVLCEFSESGEFGECRLDRFMHIKYVICA
jgi:hypothetical protein